MVSCLIKIVFLLLIAQVVPKLATGKNEDDKNKRQIKASDTTEGIKPEHLEVEEFEKAAVSSDIGQCSTVGKNILQRGGSAVDGAIATFFCLGTVQFPYSGIGGGGFMLVYSRKEKKMYGFDYKETVPSNVNKSVLEENEKKKEFGGLAVAVPGEIKGFRAAWKKFGKLKWSDVVQPSIDIAKEGFRVLEPPTADDDHDMQQADENLRRLVLKEQKPKMIYKSTIKRPQYAKTLEKIRDDPDSFYEGELADIIVSDVRKKGGVMISNDLKDYKVKMREPISTKLDDLTLHTLPLPSGGPTLIHILEICKHFNFTSDDLSTKEKIILTYHRIIEAFKFANAYRPYFCDPDFPMNVKQFKEFYEGVLDPKMAEKHFKMIDDKSTHDITYYSKKLNAKDDHGTAHVSILAENGDAVSATSSLNVKFGAHFLSDTLGLLYNDQLGDSFTRGSDEHKFTASEENSPRPFVRPLSGMAPNILLDENGDVMMVSGGAGGTKVPGSVAWMLMMKFWFGLDLANAIMAGRPQHTLFPNEVEEYKVFPLKNFINEGLKQKNHKIKLLHRSVLQVIYREGKDKKIQAKTDPHRLTRAKTDGY